MTAQQFREHISSHPKWKETQLESEFIVTLTDICEREFGGDFLYSIGLKISLDKDKKLARNALTLGVLYEFIEEQIAILAQREAVFKKIERRERAFYNGEWGEWGEIPSIYSGGSISPSDIEQMKNRLVYAEMLAKLPSADNPNAERKNSGSVWDKYDREYRLVDK